MADRSVNGLKKGGFESVSCQKNFVSLKLIVAQTLLYETPLMS